MYKLLLNYWLRRFATVAGIVTVALAAFEYVQFGASASYTDALIWGIVGGVISASLNTWWARDHVCNISDRS